ncbi:MCE family protein [Conexibacter sp. W3-3-2]|uniref:MCE family protein n=1 Tax=Paraconexibacter algicola TaxID=2133960 RepID=A0A2T4UFN1_9ACTN|nr:MULTISPECIES: MlaD family protein [Solirubrobacterales]MTD46857.1 MCE family protein [Conexibacter sp. W3-3-2]PTL56570.1 MCE family protein [Paraconexibacter algicola]
MQRRSPSLAANPVLIGAATTLIVIVAVFLAYNANSGLPFVPSYSVKTLVPSAANLVPGNEVRLGGARVGVVQDITPVRRPDGSVIAELDLKLETTVKPLPVDSTILVRPRSALGLKYVEITRGTSKRGFADGATVPFSQATPTPVEFDDVINTFDLPTRKASRTNIEEFGTAFAGRGGDLNIALQELQPLLRNLAPVMDNLADRRTRLGRFVRVLGRTSAEVAPVAQTQAALFANLDTTFVALAGVARPFIQDTISGGPAALDAGIQGFPRQRPFLANTASFARELRPGIRALSGAAPDLADALQIGTPVLRRSLDLNRRLKPTFTALQEFAADPAVKLGVADLTNLAKIANPTIAHLTPVQTVCNYVTLWFRNVASLLSVGDNNGTGQRFIIIATPQGPNAEGAPSSGPANGPLRDNYLHTNPYPNTASPGQTLECEAGNERYAAGRQVIGNVPGNQGTSTEKTTIQKDN